MTGHILFLMIYPINFFRKFTKKRTVGFFCYLVLYSALALVLYHWPLASYVFDNIDYKSSGSFVLIASIVLAHFCINGIFLSLISLMGTNLCRHLGALFFIGNSIAFYFMASYNVMLDKTMMGNVLNTNTAEALDLYHPKIFLYIVFLGILPALYLYRFKISKTSLWKKIAIIVGSLVIAVGWAFLNSSTWLWFDEHAKNLGARVLPWNYAINSLRYYFEQREKAKPKLLTDLHFEKNEETLVVLVIGEAARRANFSLYGYERLTNRQLEKQDSLTALKANSCSTYTTASIKCMLSHQGGKKGFARYENLPSYLTRFGVKVLWRTTNWGEPEMDVSLFQKREEIANATGKKCENMGYDEALLCGLTEQIESLHGLRTLVVLHQNGSHGPLYSKKYPKQFEYFTPSCKTVELQKCSPEELVNAYDNTILYNDHFLDSLIEILKQQKRRVLMIYMSDHGESLGEQGFYLHGTPKQIAPSYQYEIPFLVWTNEKFRKTRQMKPLQEEYGQDAIFHSVLGAFSGKSKEYNEKLDIFEDKNDEH